MYVCDNRRGWVAVTQKSYPLSNHDIGIVGNHSQSQLAPAVISVEVPIFFLTFFVESIAERMGTRKRWEQERDGTKKYIEKPPALSTHF
jgi:hypothetical protein